VEKVVAKYKNKVRLLIKFYPYKYRDFARISAEAALAAADQGKFWEMHGLLIRKSPDLERNRLVNYAKKIGLDVEKFKKALDSHKNDAIIERDLKLATDLGLYNTPTFFINGRKVVGNVPFKYLNKIVQEELNAKKN
jgi:protein-disulfide isomerase